MNELGWWQKIQKIYHILGGNCNHTHYSEYRLKREKSRFWVKNDISVKVMASKWFLLLFSNVTWWMNLADDKKSKNYIISWEEIATIPIIANIGLKVKNHDFELRMILTSKLWHQSGFYCCFLMQYDGSTLLMAKNPKIISYPGSKL